MEGTKLPEPTPEAFQLSLRIRHPSMDPTDLSRALNMDPEHAFAAGAPRRAGSSNVSASLHTETYWLGVLKSPVATDDAAFFRDDLARIAERQLQAAQRSLSWALGLSAGRFLSGHADLFRRLRAEGAEVALLVTIYNGEVTHFSVAPETSQMLGQLGITVEFELE